LDTTIITLKLPNDLANLVRKYAKPFIVNTQPSIPVGKGNIYIPFTKGIEGEKEFEVPSLDDVVDECKKRRSRVSAQRFFSYYNARDWRNKDGSRFDWKVKLAEWEGYNLEKSPVEQVKEKTPPVNRADVEAFLRGA
jgi:hypothetical protein